MAMRIQDANIISIKTRIELAGSKHFLYGVYLYQGAQILRVPSNNKCIIRDITLHRGASYESKWAALRGAVLKFHKDRKASVMINGNGFQIPSAHVLMDHESFTSITEKEGNRRINVPRIIVETISLEKYYLVHASYSHPDQLFIPKGRYTQTKFTLWVDLFAGHMKLENGVLYLEEDFLDSEKKNVNVLERFDTEPKSIIMHLKEGGYLTLSESFFRFDHLRHLLFLRFLLYSKLYLEPFLY